MFSRSRSQDKGKGRQTEQSPLLPSSTSGDGVGEGPSSYSDPSPSRRTPVRPPQQSSNLKSHLLTFLYVFLTILVAIALALVVLASSLASSTQDTEQLTRAVVWRGPEEVRVLNVTEADGVWVEVKAWVGVDTDAALGFDTQRDIEGDWWERLRRGWARWGVDTVDVASVHFPSPLNLYSAPPYLSSTPLISLTPSPSTILVPLTSSLHSSTPPVFPPNPFPRHQDIPPWLTPFTLQFQTHVVASPEEVLEFVKRSWSGQKVDVRLVMDSLEISGVGRWLKWVKGEKRNVELDLRIPIPRIPSLPFPPPTNLTDLIHLDTYKVHRSRPTPAEPQPQLVLEATASVPNILGGMTGMFPFEVEFEVGVSVQDDGNDPDQGAAVAPVIGRRGANDRIAVVHTRPISFNPFSPNITVSISGLILPPHDKPSPSPNSSTSITTPTNSTTTSSPLARFVQAYLSSQPLPVILTHLPPRPHSLRPIPKPISDILLAFTPIAFPIPPPKPPIKLIRSVTIEGMKIAGTGPDGKEIRASGTVRAEVEVPGGLIGEEGVGVDVREVRPDVYIHNGPTPPNSPAPDYPLAFGRLHPTDSLQSTTLPHPSGNPLLLLVLAPFENLPLEILRPNELSNFVGKILVRGGAVAGVKGTADVGVVVEGLGENKLEIGGIGVEGEIWVGRGGR